MKKLIAILCLSTLALFTSSPLIAGGITNKQNFSTEYLRTSSRNTATDSADAAVYNPAGVMQMEDGIYINGGAFYAFKDYSNTIGGKEYSSDEPSIVPSLIGLYKKGNWAAFGAFTIPYGGGKVVYNQGDATTMGYGMALIAGANQLLRLPPPYGYSLLFDAYDNISAQSIEAESIGYGFTVGGAYQINELISIALGLRYIDSNKEAQASISIGPSAMGTAAGIPVRIFDIDYEEKADGWGGFIGLNITPQDSLNIGLRYETATKLDYETSVNKDDTGMLVNGAIQREDLPGLLGMGLGYRINPELKLDMSLTYYLEKSADRQAARFQDVDNGYDLAVALEFVISPRLKGSLGYMYTNIKMDPDDMQPEAAELDANTFCGGLVYALRPGLDLNFALMKNIYSSEVRSDGIELGKDLFNIGFGLQYKF
jgi:long-chain fatty acid transport protein